ncbi:MAG: magnesium/cobalt transporter CorA [Treponema sp.]|jgi:magnesium transporter|nr:magnesium/cobalt transporter CorA [Treponema sp.]
MDLSIIGYDPVGAWMKTADTVDELLSYRNPAGITWINVNDPVNLGGLSRIAEFFHIHPLTMEDIMDTGQRPKIEEFDNYLFIILKALNSGDSPVTEQISLVLMEDTVITFQEIPGDSFDGIRKRILNNAGRIRRMGADYLAYALMDSVVDAYFLVLDALGAGIENFEERAIDENDRELIPDLQRAKQDLIRVRRVIWPLRESLSVLLRLDSKLINDVLRPFLKDLQDNIIQAVETVENYRELMAGVMEVNLSSISNRMNGVMKVLTIISTIFIPLTFIVGVYGMNFVYMPELSYPYAYPITWAGMVLIAAGMLFYFKRRHWI